MVAEKRQNTDRPGPPAVAAAVLRLARAFARGDARLGYLPLYLWIEPTNRCNLRCPMCPQSDGLKRPSGMMDAALFDKIAGEAAGAVKLLSMHFAGEPLLHKKLSDMVRTASSRGLPTIIHSNGTLIDADLGGRLIDAGLDQIVFSFDAVPESDYEKKRPPAKFDETLSRLREFLQEKKRRGARTPLVTIKSIVFHDPAAQPPDVSALKRLFAGLPVDRFCTEPAHTFAGGFAEGVLREKRYSVMERGQVCGCVLPWYGFAIGWDGSAFACCNDLNGEYPLGDVNSQSIFDIWNGAQMLELRRRLAAKDIASIPLCSSCNAPYRRTSTRDIALEALRYTVKYNLRNRLR